MELDDGGAIRVDDQCRAADGVWAAGDVTGIAPFTHVAHYQGRLVADVILGRTRVADYRAVPRVVFGDPEFAAAGQTRAQGEEAGIDLAEGRVELQTLARTDAYGAGYEGEMRVLADRATGAPVRCVGNRAARVGVDRGGRGRDQGACARRHPARHADAVPDLRRGPVVRRR